MHDADEHLDAGLDHPLDEDARLPVTVCLERVSHRARGALDGASAVQPERDRAGVALVQERRGDPLERDLATELAQL